eukprot:scaffold123497_cov39-Tisochrysis_lutea.AAC.1
MHNAMWVGTQSGKCRLHQLQSEASREAEPPAREDCPLAGEWLQPFLRPQEVWRHVRAVAELPHFAR